MLYKLKVIAERLIPNNGYGNDRLRREPIAMSIELDEKPKNGCVYIGSMNFSVKQEGEEITELNDIAVSTEYRLLNFLWEGWTMRLEYE